MKKITKSAGETKKIAAKIAKDFLKNGPGKTAAVFALQGELGSGKTTFVQGFYSGLGLKKRATSPTFVILRRHRIPRPKRFSTTNHSLPTTYSFVYHMDAYRLKSGKDARPLELKKLFRDPENVILIEWPKNIKSVLPEKIIWIKFFHGKKERERTLIF